MSSLVKKKYSEITPKKHNFDLAVKKIRDFANSAPSIPEINKFQVDGSFWGFTDHNVTGEEMNQHVAEINKIFIQQNRLIVSTIKEFQAIYNTFNELDQDYIAGIVTSLNGVKKAIEEAAYAQKCIEKSQLDILATQEDIQKANKQIENTNRDIQKTIEALKVTVNSLLDNKRKVAKLEERLSDWELLRGDVIRIKKNVNLEKIEKLQISAQTYAAQYEKISNELKFNKDCTDALALMQSQYKADTDRQLADQQANAERIENDMLVCVDTINQKVDVLRKSIDEQLNESIALLKQAIANVSKDSKERTDALALVESQHKTDTDQQLADQKTNANRIENEMHSNVEAINKNAEIFKKLALAKLSDSESSIMNIISQLNEQYNIDKTQTKTKFRWLFGIAGSSLLLNIMLIIFKYLGIL